MTTNIRPISPDDQKAIVELHARSFGPGRFARTAYRIRERGGSEAKCSRAMFDGDRLIASVRLSEISIGGKSGAVLLGPIVVTPELKDNGRGSALMQAAIDAARSDGHRAIILVGNEPFYGLFGFKPIPPGDIVMPGPVDPTRLLALELVDGAMTGYKGLISSKA